MKNVSSLGSRKNEKYKDGFIVKRRGHLCFINKKNRRQNARQA